VRVAELEETVVTVSLSVAAVAPLMVTLGRSERAGAATYFRR